MEAMNSTNGEKVQRVKQWEGRAASRYQLSAKTVGAKRARCTELSIVMSLRNLIWYYYDIIMTLF